MENSNIYQKLHNARKFIKTCDMSKQGKNEHFSFPYYTPEQVSQLVFQACEEQKLIPLFNLKKNDLGYYGELTVVNFENTEEKIVFEMSTDIPKIQAATITQQLGGTVTYTERYLLMTAFDIKDNNLDPDNTMKKSASNSQSKNTQEPEKKWLNKWADKEHQRPSTDYLKVVDWAKENNYDVKKLLEFYKISKDVQTALETDLA